MEEIESLRMKGASTPTHREARRRVEAYCRDRPELSMCSCEVREVRVIERDVWVFLDSPDRRCPELFLIRGSSKESAAEIIPYFAIQERPGRQIVSYSLGKGLCNLAEVKELFGRLYSRYCGSYLVGELPQKRGSLSRIALWVHDCLTEDFDHQIALNRQNLEEGVCISYDFGMAFSNHYFPPFYTMELGISDTSILEHRLFLLEVLSRYARWVRADEGGTVSRLQRSYPTTSHGDRCRYCLRNYKAHFRTRLYFGRFFEKMRNAPFERERLYEIAKSIELDMDGVSDWGSLVEIIRSSPRRRLDLRGLDLSDMDLRRADLKGADLTGASLAGADLEDADMRGANLSGVDMRGTNLKGVKLDQT
jgi:hypothetical protein